MTKDEVEPYYLRRAVDLIDCMFDQGYFSKDLKRKDMRALDDLFAYYIQSEVKSAIRAKEFLRKING